jgi:hypothetical protein
MPVNGLYTLRRVWHCGRACQEALYLETVRGGEFTHHARQGALYPETPEGRLLCFNACQWALYIIH